MIQELKKLRKELEGTTYPTSEQVAKYLNLAYELDNEADYDIISESYALDMLQNKNTLYEVRNFLQDVTDNGYDTQFYILDGYGCLVDLTSEIIIDKIDDILKYKGVQENEK